MNGFGSMLLDALESVGAPEVYGLVAIAALAETTVLADVIIPGELAMVLAGVVVVMGDAELPLMIVAAALGAVVGDTVSYTIGRKWGTPVICRLGVLRRVLAPRLHRARHFFQDHGGAAVFVGRFVGLFRGLVPVAAGIARMRFRRFLAWNVAASVAWAGTVITLGFLLGDPIARFLERSGAVLLIGAMAAAIAILAFRLVRRRVHGTVADEEAARAFCDFDVPKLEPGATLAVPASDRPAASRVA